MTRDDVIDLLRKKKNGRSLRALAQDVGCSAMYLSDLFSGNRNPGPKVLDYLGLECEVITEFMYRRKYLPNRKQEKH